MFEPTFSFPLGEDIAALRDAVRDFAQNEIAPRAAGIDKANEFPADMWKKLRGLGVMGLAVPEEFGGSQLGYLARGRDGSMPSTSAVSITYELGGGACCRSSGDYVTSAQ